MKQILTIALAAQFVALSQVRYVDPPVHPESGMPHLAVTPGGKTYLAWTEPASVEKEHALRLSRWNGTAWTEPETITQGKNWFVNWADFGALSVLPDGSMLAHWLTRSGAGAKFGYGIRVAKRAPDKPAWREIHGMSLDEKTDYAGFLSFVPNGSGAVYLSPPAHSDHTAAAGHGDGHDDHRKTVRFISFRQDGTVEADQEVDSDACSCCPTTIGRTRSGLIAAYRDHLPGEIRDIAVIRQVNGKWTEPKTLHADGWKINACPTDGPSLVSKDSRVAIAWLTRANNEPKVQLAFSKDEGERFGAPLRIDSGSPLGRPAIVPYDADTYLVGWLERLPSGQVEIRIRRASFEGKLHKPITIATVPAGRASGFPKLVIHSDQILFAWRDGKVRAAILTKSQLKEQEDQQ